MNQKAVLPLCAVIVVCSYGDRSAARGKVETNCKIGTKVTPEPVGAIRSRFRIAGDLSRVSRAVGR